MGDISLIKWFVFRDKLSVLRDRLLDTCRTGQGVFVLGLRLLGHVRLAKTAEESIGVTR